MRACLSCSTRRTCTHESQRLARARSGSWCTHRHHRHFADPTRPGPKRVSSNGPDYVPALPLTHPPVLQASPPVLQASPTCLASIVPAFAGEGAAWQSAQHTAAGRTASERVTRCLHLDIHIDMGSHVSKGHRCVAHLDQTDDAIELHVTRATDRHTTHRHALVTNL